MLKIRLARVGKRNQAIYRIVVAEHARPVKGKFVEILGVYNPRDKENPIEIKKDRVEYWMSNGAKPTFTMMGILKKKNILPKDLVEFYDKEAARLKELAKKRGKKKDQGKEEDETADNADKKADSADKVEDKVSEAKSEGKEKVDAEKKPKEDKPKDDKKPKAEEKKNEKKATTETQKDTETQKKSDDKKPEDKADKK